MKGAIRLGDQQNCPINKAAFRSPKGGDRMVGGNTFGPFDLAFKLPEGQ